MKELSLYKSYGYSFMPKLAFDFVSMIEKQAGVVYQSMGIIIPVITSSTLVLIATQQKASLLEIARRLDIPHQLAAQRVKTLLKLQVISADKDNSDKRRTNYQLTALGQQQHQLLLTYLQHADKVFAALTIELGVDLMAVLTAANRSFVERPLTSRIHQGSFIMTKFLVVLALLFTWHVNADNTQIIDDVANIVEAQFVSPTIAATVATELRQADFKSKMAAIKDPKEFATKLTKALKAMSGDNHIGIVYSPTDVQRYRIRQQAKTNPTAQKQQASNHAQELAAAAAVNFGIQQVRLLDGDVGYLEMSYFDGFVDESAPMFAAAMNMLAGAKIIILDLRRNGGGNSRVLPLFLSYFLGPEPVHFATKTERWNNSTELLFTMSKVQGQRHLNKPIYILTSGTTFSLAEHLTYHLRAFNRAIVVGERTYGGGRAFDPIVVNDDFYLRMPRVDVVNALTKQIYKEGEGITPDVETTSQAAFHQAYLLALNTLENQQKNATQQQYYQWVKRIVTAQAYPEQLQFPLPQLVKHHRFADFEFEIRQHELWLSFRKLPWVKLINLGHGYFYDDRSIQRQFSFLKEEHGFQLNVYPVGEPAISIKEVFD